MVDMGSKGRLPPPHMRRPLPGAGLIHPDPFGPGIRPPPGAFPPFDMLPPPEVLEQKITTQHVEMQRLVTENHRLAATHVSLREELAGAQHDLQRLNANANSLRDEKDQQLRNLMDRIAKLEVELQAADSVNLELQQARVQAQDLISSRQELIAKVEQLTQDLQRSHSDVQQVPALLHELEGLKQEYQHCRATYDYEKKLYNDHYDSLQVMEKNYVSMTREVEKLRAELGIAANLERKTGEPYGGATGYKDTEAAGHHSVAGQNTYDDRYNAPQERATLPGPPPYGSGPVASGARAGYDAPRGPGYDGSRGSGYDSTRGPGYDAARGGSYEAPRGGPGYDAQPRGAGGPQAQVPGNNAPYGSATPPTRAGAGAYNGPPRAGNPAMR